MTVWCNTVHGLTEKGTLCDISVYQYSQIHLSVSRAKIQCVFFPQKYENSMATSAEAIQSGPIIQRAVFIVKFEGTSKLRVPYRGNLSVSKHTLWTHVYTHAWVDYASQKHRIIIKKHCARTTDKAIRLVRYKVWIRFNTRIYIPTINSRGGKSLNDRCCCQRCYCDNEQYVYNYFNIRNLYCENPDITVRLVY